ncbi:hypothetical protein ACWED2_17060 [Amycolatopsis sp. NPDC005003]
MLLRGMLGVAVLVATFDVGDGASAEAGEGVAPEFAVQGTAAGQSSAQIGSAQAGAEQNGVSSAASGLR